MRRLRTGKLLLALVLLVTLGAAGKASAQAIIIAPGEAITIGVIVTLGGDIADIGIASERGIRLAQEEGPQLQFGATTFAIELAIHDSACSAAGGAAAAATLIEEDRAVAVIGPNCSSACLAAAARFEVAGFTSLSPSCSNPRLTELGFTSFHRLANPNDRLAANAIRHLFTTTGARRLAILQQPDEAYYQGLAAAAATEFVALGGEIVLDFALDVEQEAAQVIAETVAAGADAIYCACNAGWASALLSLPEAPQRQLPFFGESHDWARNLVARLGAGADGIYFSADYPYEMPGSRELAARYEARFGEAPVSPYFANAYDAYQLLLAAIHAVTELTDDGSLHIDRAALRAEIRNTSDYDGASGTIGCDESGECLIMPTALFQIQDGAFTLLAVFLPLSEPNGEE